MKKSTGRREDSGRRRLGIVLFIVIAAIISGLIALTILSLRENTSVKTELPLYNGKYSGELRDLAVKYLAVDHPVYNRTFKYLFTEYYKELYNTDPLWNRTFSVKVNSSMVYRFKATYNETIIIDTYGNGTYYYALSLDSRGIYIIEGSESPGNSSRIFRFDISPRYFSRAYIDVYLIVSSNSSKTVSGYIVVSRKPPIDLGVVLRRAGIEFSTLLIYEWIRDTYNVEDHGLEEIIEHSMDPASILETNKTAINSFEESLLFKRLLDILKIDSHIIAVDLDGDDVVDHFALVIKAPQNDPVLYSDNLMNILEGLNRDYVVGEGRIHVKYLVYNNIAWIIIDPVYGEDYIPGQLDSANYRVLGIIV